MKKDMKAIEGEAVARQGNGNREWTQIAISSPTENRVNREILELRENSFVCFSRVRGYVSFLDFLNLLMQVVDFLVIFRYFSCFFRRAWRKWPSNWLLLHQFAMDTEKNQSAKKRDAPLLRSAFN
jgi:hypothetical protein